MFDPGLKMSLFWPVMTLKLINIETKAKKKPTKSNRRKVIFYLHILPSRF
jgi:hypothetical protein